ncbi:MAG TPA: 2-hydroxyhepta-2,4-diene-1,7-dioate isomerase [Arenibacter sp.]|jgi:2-dehydro-3-deoxy-D-arabinonate dehydratase|nr:fumarylacetoacetate hydrolase family protein [Arenibacter algicola]HCO82994.1 2-hydroxyhepta-2,4-diene-1,7-dioate isomerase [Arenibacter sp.]|tara:strand:- start:643 stop:1476 length:834 start_codon:yes stop_codon:yes gene_type:complete
MKIYKTNQGVLIENDNKFYLTDKEWDSFIVDDDIYDNTLSLISGLDPIENSAAILKDGLMPPVGRQEIWASGVTYYKSREARIEESKDAGGGDFYDRVYNAERPELFFKSTASRAVGHKQDVRIRKDSKWNVPEPELTLVITPNAKIIGYTIGNDMSSRDIEGENPLYLPQAKSYDGAAAVGPCIWLSKEPISMAAKIKIEIVRKGNRVFQGETEVGQMKRKLTDLVHYLYREMSFPFGSLLMTGTGVVPPDSFTLDHGDVVNITIDSIGTLSNTVA